MSLREAELREVLRQLTESPGSDPPPVVALGVSSPWEGGPTLDVDGRSVDVAYCASNLGMREQLAWRTEAMGSLALLTDLREIDLEQDVLARLYRRRIITLDSWQVVLGLFKAREIDPRLRKHGWIAELLLASAPAGGYPAAPSGYLDAERVWGLLLRDRLGFDDLRPDPEAVLRWTLDPARRDALAAEAGAFRETVPAWIEGFSGRTGWFMMQAVGAGYGGDAVALGLVLDVLYAGELVASPAVDKARVRLEPFVGGNEIPESVARSWADAARSVLHGAWPNGSAATREAMLQRAETILAEVGAGEAAIVSRELRSGLERRIEAYGVALSRVLKARDATALDALQDAERRVLEHERLAAEAAQAESAVRMATRLARWLVRNMNGDHTAGSLAEAALRYEATGGFVDWARSEIWADDGGVARLEATHELLSAVDERREAENRRFGVLLANACENGFDEASVLPIEHVLHDVVVPLARKTPVLLLVMDGMSQAVFRSLEEDLVARGWIGWALATGTPRAVIAALPTVTSVCRTSLLTGTLREGASGDEQNGFAAHPELVAASQQRHPPKLFVKGDLTGEEGFGLDEMLRREVLSDRRRVVGVVINAVDDYLAKGDQLRPGWHVSSIRHLGALLDAARQRGRAVVLTADHGHVLERNLEARKVQAEGARYRRAARGEAAEGEVKLEGARVVSGVPILAPWSERVRYKGKQNGYHGGASPQEVVVPLQVLACGVPVPEGWREVSPERPDWWTPDVVAATAIQPATPPVLPVEVARPGELPFEESAPGEVAWIQALLASERFQQQKQRAGRTAPPEVELVALFEALDARGSSLTRAALAQQLMKPPVRLAGFLEGVRRILNVDGYDVLSVDDVADRVRIDHALLVTQFELKIEEP